VRWEVTINRVQRIRKFFDYDFYPLFICGVAGSGTTLLGSLLDQWYENSAYINESALSIAPAGSVLKMNKIAFYSTLSNYYRAIFIPDNISDKQVRRSLIELYRRVVTYPKKSNIIIDKAPTLHLVRAKRLRNAISPSKFLLVVRDPISSVEGLRRKWPLFAQADLIEVCDFWESIHRIFLEETSAFASDVISLSYDDLTRQTEAVLDRIAKSCGLQCRETPKMYTNRPNVPGKGLRNVVNGVVKIVPQTDAQSTFCLSPQETDYIQRRLGPVYDQLKVRSKV
jgi:hypothetical protein